MKKEEFLASMKQKLDLLPDAEVDSRLEYFSECIDDRIEDGMSEDEAVAAMGEPTQVAQEVLLEAPLPTLMKGANKKRPALKGWHIVLLILGAPVWLPLLLAGAAIGVSAVAVLLALLASLAAVVLAMTVGGVVLLVTGAARAFAGDSQGIAIIGGAMLMAGVGIFLFFALRALTGLYIRGFRAVLLRLKRKTIEKREVS